MTGRKWQYRAVQGEDTIAFRMNGDWEWIKVKIEDIEQIAKELQTIARNADKITCGTGLEVW